MKPVVFSLHGHEELSRVVAERLDGEIGNLVLRRFPDGESYVRLETQVEDREVILVCSMNNPDDKILQLYFTGVAAHELGAKTVGLVAPYLTYMRQDKRFQPGEAMTSSSFARLLSLFADWLVTVDPHLHRHSSLSDLYSIPASAVAAAPMVAHWIRSNIGSPVLIGPDEESAQWVNRVAELARAPSIVLRKVRRGDRDVEISAPALQRWRDATPVLVDDIISTAHTMIETIVHVKSAGLRPPVCIGVHAVFAQDALRGLLAAGAARVVTCNTIRHETNGIDLSEPLVSCIRELVQSRRNMS